MSETTTPLSASDDDALERERLPLARGRELAEYAGVALFGMLDLAARLHNVVYREDAAALARLCELYLEPREEVARAECAQLVAVYRQHAVLKRRFVAETHGTYVDIVYFKRFSHDFTPFGDNAAPGPRATAKAEAFGAAYSVVRFYCLIISETPLGMTATPAEAPFSARARA